MGLKTVLVLNNRKENTEQATKHRIIDLRRPIALTSHPDRKPPVSPPIPNIIILKPRSFWASAKGSRLCIQVGSQEKMAHRPISIVPKIMEPVNKSARCSPK